MQIKNQINKICKEKTQIFIIDELDRCKPNFAINTLEIVKHFFDIKNCVFIICVDKQQIEESIKTIYGSGISSNKYFSKLFDYQFNLLPISFYDSVDTSEITNINVLVEWSSKVFNVLGISLRDSKKIFNDIIQKNKNWTIEQSLFMLLFVILKYTDLSFYNAILNGVYIKYRKVFESQYNNDLERYNRLMNFRIGDGQTYGIILDELNLFINRYFSELRNDTSNSHIMIVVQVSQKKKLLRIFLNIYQK